VAVEKGGNVVMREYGQDYKSGKISDYSVSSINVYSAKRVEGKESCR
jgi:hypothetical protein